MAARLPGAMKKLASSPLTLNADIGRMRRFNFVVDI